MQYPNEQYVVSVDADGAKTQQDLENLVVRQSDIDLFASRYPSSKIFSFEQV